MGASGTLEYRKHSTFLLRILSYSSFSTGIGAWFLIDPPLELLPPLWAQVIGVLCLVFGVPFTVLILRQLFFTGPAIVMDDEGFTDNSSSLAAGHVPWAAVNGIDLIEAVGRPTIRVLIKDVDGFLGLDRNVVKRKLMELNHNSYGSPVLMTADLIECDAHALVDELTGRWQAYLERNGPPGRLQLIPADKAMRKQLGLTRLGDVYSFVADDGRWHAIICMEEHRDRSPITFYFAATDMVADACPTLNDVLGSCFYGHASARDNAGLSPDDIAHMQQTVPDLDGYIGAYMFLITRAELLEADSTVSYLGNLQVMPDLKMNGTGGANLHSWEYARSLFAADLKSMLKEQNQVLFPVRAIVR